MMELRYSADKVRYKRMTSSELKESYVVDNLYQPDEVPLTYSDIDRGVIGSAVPVKEELGLPINKELACDYFTQRREIGVLNIGGAGQIIVNDEAFLLDFEDSLYIGRGNEKVIFKSDDSENPAKFYFVSYPAHTSYPTKLITKNMANRIELGSLEASNRRVIYQSIRPGVVESCQVVMGFTCLEAGNVWNTMPPHTHGRRSEYYMYYTLSEENRVFHMMGEPDNIRPLILSNGEVALSPSWSIHSGAGTSAYTFCWAMGGENQEFTDMDHLTIADLA
jgi:4-deoxy-L-threo-5-hexosulose-uronate ketol-isomerase